MDCHGNVEISGVRESRGSIRLEDVHDGKRVSRLGNDSLSVLNANLALRGDF